MDFVKKHDKQCFGKPLPFVACGKMQSNKLLLTHDPGDLVTNMKETIKEEFKGKKNPLLVPLFPFITRRKWNVQKKVLGLGSSSSPRQDDKQIVLITRKISQAFLSTTMWNTSTRDNM